VQWAASPGLPDHGWAGPTFQTVAAQHAADKAKEDQAKADGATATATAASAGAHE
jgi:hypothetical protein